MTLARSDDVVVAFWVTAVSNKLEWSWHEVHQQPPIHSAPSSLADKATSLLRRRRGRVPPLARLGVSTFKEALDKAPEDVASFYDSAGYWYAERHFGGDRFSYVDMYLGQSPAGYMGQAFLAPPRSSDFRAADMGFAPEDDEYDLAHFRARAIVNSYGQAPTALGVEAVSGMMKTLHSMRLLTLHRR